MAQGWLERPYSLEGKRIWVAGHRGMVGQALVRALSDQACKALTVKRDALDLRNQAETFGWLRENKLDVVILAAARVGGICANERAPAEFLYDNLMIESNVIHGAYKAGVEKLLFLGSSCIYPKEAKNPISEEALLSGALEPTNAPYALAKIAGIKLCQAYRAQYGCDFISAMPCNLYGPGDRFDEQDSHVIPALMMKAHKAKKAGAPFMEVWGSGRPRREFLYVDDLAGALVMLLQNYSSGQLLNIGAGTDVTIKELAEMISDVAGFKGGLKLNKTKPDGAYRKLMSSSRIKKAGWAPSTELRAGLVKTYEWFLQNEKSGKLDGKAAAA